MERRTWTVADDTASATQRPDGRWTLRLPESAGAGVRAQLLAARPSDLGRCTVTLREDAAGGAELAAAGFVPVRQEQTWRIPVGAPSQPPILAPAHRLRQVLDCDLARVAELDSAVRRQIPGTQDWSTSEQEVAQSLRDDEFDPALYLIAEGVETGDYDGLVRVWRRSPEPRIGCLGVRPAWRRTRLGPALLTAVMGTLAERGVRHVVAETDLTNADSFTLAARHGGVPQWRLIEWALEPGDGGPR